MNFISWKYTKDLENENSIEEIEGKYDIEIPNALKEEITKHNGGRPDKNLFNTCKNVEKVFKCLLSYNKEDKENIYMCINFFEKRYIPFGITEFGDMICINTGLGTVELYLHELDKFENVCEDVEEFFKELYNEDDCVPERLIMVQEKDSDGSRKYCIDIEKANDVHYELSDSSKKLLESYLNKKYNTTELKNGIIEFYKTHKEYRLGDLLNKLNIPYKRFCYGDF